MRLRVFNRAASSCLLLPVLVVFPAAVPFFQFFPVICTGILFRSFRVGVGASDA